MHQPPKACIIALRAGRACGPCHESTRRIRAALGSRGPRFIATRCCSLSWQGRPSAAMPSSSPLDCGLFALRHPPPKKKRLAGGRPPARRIFSLEIDRRRNALYLNMMQIHNERQRVPGGNPLFFAQNSSLPPFWEVVKGRRFLHASSGRTSREWRARPGVRQFCGPGKAAGGGAPRGRSGDSAAPTGGMGRRKTVAETVFPRRNRVS